MRTDPSAPPRLALVGDRSPAVKAHARITALGGALGPAGSEPIEAYWLHSTTIDGPGDLAGFDGVWVVPGCPYANPAGVLDAIEHARRTGTPLLGTCGGFQHLLLEFARNVCGIRSASSAEEHPDADELLIIPLECSLLGEEETVSGRSAERYFCRYGLNLDYLPALIGHGLIVSGTDRQGGPRMVELPHHPFFVGALFQPELSSDPTWVHPLIAAFGAAVLAHRDASVGAGA
jgi:CTP synthase (UTP-ammonia lyase)